MSEPALKEDVIAALRAQGIVVNELPDGKHIEILAVGKMNRVIEIDDVVSRRYCRRLQRWYGVPMGAFFPPFKPTTPEAKK